MIPSGTIEQQLTSAKVINTVSFSFSVTAFSRASEVGGATADLVSKNWPLSSGGLKGTGTHSKQCIFNDLPPGSWI